jgi:phage-related tail fiber protein
MPLAAESAWTRAAANADGPYILSNSAEAAASRRAYQQAFNSANELVIGRLDDTAAGSQLSMGRLNEPDWTINVNDAWVNGGIDARQPFYLGSPITIGNLRSGNATFPTTVYFRELTQLRDAGYYRQGGYMLPPPKP